MFGTQGIVVIKPVENFFKNFRLRDVVGRQKRSASVKLFRVVVDYFHAEAVEGVNCHAVSRAPDQAGQALPHIKSSRVGESQAQYIFRRGVGQAQDVGHAQAQKLCFARPRPGHHHHRPLYRFNRLSLPVI